MYTLYPLFANTTDKIITSLRRNPAANNFAYFRSSLGEILHIRV